MRKWRGRAGGVSVKSGQEHVCKDAGVQAAEVQRTLGSACPHSRAAAAVSDAAAAPRRVDPMHARDGGGERQPSLLAKQ